jgi:tetratricopeptide (TPR) repeat protein
MKYQLELELRQYRQAVVDGLASSTRQQAQMLSRQGDGLNELIGGLNFVGSSLAGVEGSLDIIGADLARLATTVDSALPSIVEYLAISVTEIKDISQMMATPEETRAAERFRNGTLALKKAQQAGSPTRAQQWYDLAAHDLREAVEIHKYHPKSWFNLGITLGRLDRAEEAAAAFESSAFFGVDQSLEFGATAVLLAAGLYRQADLSDKSAEILHEYLEQLDRCAEIHLALGIHHGEPERLTRALELWPRLANDARRAGAPEIEAVAADLCLRPGGVLSQIRELHKAIQALVNASSVAGMPQIHSIPTVNTPPPSKVDILLLTTSWWLKSLGVACQLMAEVKTGILQLEKEAEAADQYVVQAKVDARTRMTSEYARVSALIAQERQAGITRASLTRDAALALCVRHRMIYVGPEYTAMLNHEGAVREVEETYRAAQARASERFLGAREVEREVERIGAEAQVLADAAHRKPGLATAIVAEPLSSLEALIQSANTYSDRIIPFRLQDF